MKPTITELQLDGESVGHLAQIELDGHVFEWSGKTPEKAVENLRECLRKQVERGRAAQRLLYLMTDPAADATKTSNDGA